jgi:hypothetical protein
VKIKWRIELEFTILHPILLIRHIDSEVRRKERNHGTRTDSTNIVVVTGDVTLDWNIARAAPQVTDSPECG